jgi:hypothetical protein
MVEVLEGMTLEEGEDFPQGTKTIRAEDHQAFTDMFISRIDANGIPEVLRKVTAAEAIYPASADYRDQRI